MSKRLDWPHLAMLLASMLCGGTAWAARDAAPLLGVISLPAVLAATAGAGLVLSFLPPREVPLPKLLGTIAFCAVLGVLGSATAVRVVAGYVEAFAGPGAEVVVAFLVGAIAQVVIPLLIERRGDLLGRLLPKRGQ